MPSTGELGLPAAFRRLTVGRFPAAAPRPTPAEVSPFEWYRGPVTTKHVRFAIHDVTFGGIGLPGATVDCWDDSEGHSRWSARIVTRVGPALDEGELTGRMADGRSLSGHAVVANRQVGAGGRRETLVELHGSGDLHGLVVDPSAADAS
jgi:hypothetical protein